MSGQDAKPDIDQIAADWVVRLDARAPSGEERHALDHWLEQDERHFGAYMRARAIFLHFDGLRLQRAVERYVPPPVIGQRLLTRRGALLLAGGSLAAGLVGMGVFALRPEQEFSTRIGEVRRVPLPDGSAVTLNTQTRVVVQFTKLTREVRLLAGEALFEVAADAMRAFTVNTFATSITSAAAAFSVRALRQDDIQVLVREGEVQVASATRPTPVALRANSVIRPVTSRSNGPSGRAAQAPVAEPLAPVEVDRRLAWQRGLLSFEDVSLSDALQEFARYSDTRIVLDDPSIAQLKVVGLYSAADPIGFAKTVAISLGLRVEVRDGVAHLNSA